MFARCAQALVNIMFTVRTFKPWIARAFVRANRNRGVLTGFGALGTVGAWIAGAFVDISIADTIEQDLTCRELGILFQT